MFELEFDRLIHALDGSLTMRPPVILPDFFVDHFVIAGGLEALFREMRVVAEQGGGNLMGTRHLIRRGGNSPNTASALLSLGLAPVLITKTDPQGAALLRALTDPTMDLSHVHCDGRLAATVSIEAEYNGRRVNLMVSDSGSAADFSYSDLSDADLRCIRDSSLVALLCLNHNRAAADLASNLFEMVHQESRALTFMDMGDPSGNPGIVKPLVDNVIREGLVDIVSMNENEARWFLVALEDSTRDWSRLIGEPELWLGAAERISAETGIRVDLHTPHFSASVKGSHSVAVPTFSEVSRVVCGAGDSWNAGDILGTLMSLEVEDRLVLANAVAAKYVSSPDARHPTREEVMTYLRSSPSMSHQGKRLLGIQ